MAFSGSTAPVFVVAGRRRDAERPEAGPAIHRDHVGPGRPYIHPELLVDRDRPDSVRHDPGQPGRLAHRVMHLCVEPYSTPARMSAPRCRSRAHSTALNCAIDPPVVNSPAGFGGKGHPVAQPVERVGLELNQGRGGQPHPGVAIDHGGDQVRQPRRIQPAARDVGEIAGAPTT